MPGMKNQRTVIKQNVSRTRLNRMGYINIYIFENYFLLEIVKLLHKLLHLNIRLSEFGILRL